MPMLRQGQSSTSRSVRTVIPSTLNRGLESVRYFLRVAIDLLTSFDLEVLRRIAMRMVQRHGTPFLLLFAGIAIGFFLSAHWVPNVSAVGRQDYESLEAFSNILSIEIGRASCRERE